MRLTADGLLGLGTTSPTGNLEIDTASTTSMIMLDVSGTNFARIGHNTSSGTNMLDVRSEGHTRFLTGGNNERIRIDSSGRVGIGNTNPGSFHSSGQPLVVGSGSGEEGMTIFSGNSSNGVINFADGTSSSDSFEGRIIYSHADNSMRFNVNDGSERMRIDSSGRVLIGTTSSRGTANGNARFQVENTSTEQASFVRTSNDNGSSVVAIGKTRNGSIVQSGDIVGSINFVGDDGTDLNTSCAEVRAAVDATPGSNDMPGRLEFRTTANGAAASTERMRIDQSGNVGINESASNMSNGKLTVKIDTNKHIGFSGTQGEVNNVPALVAYQDNGSLKEMGFRGVDLRFATGSAERVRIDDAGNLLIGSTSYNNGSFGGSARGINISQAQPQILLHESDTGSDGYLGIANSIFRLTSADSIPITFATADTERMRIDQNGNVGIGSSPLSRFSIVQSISDGTMMTMRNTQSRANNVRYGIEFRDSSNETNATIAVRQLGSNNKGVLEVYANNGSGGNGITGGTSARKVATFGFGGFTVHNELNMHNSDGQDESKFFDIGFRNHTFNMRRTSGADDSHTNFITVNSSNVVSGNFNDTSDEKLKKNIVSVVDGAIENIKKLRPVTFDWIDATRNNDVSGFIAQEVKEVLPNLVDGAEYDPTLIDETTGSKGGIKSQGYSINTIGLVAHLTKALQEEITKREALETRIAALEAA